uniref:MATA-HMG n=1 Tax=Rhizophagus irregularis TaxID=588596 RepID=A0A1B1EUM6_9GLOM|nr:MATA-HMG [Rhizophagus irregularis]
MTFTKVVWDLYTLYTRNHYLIVAQRCIEIPSPADLSTQYYRCNGFLIYRGLLQDVFQGKMIVDISRGLQARLGKSLVKILNNFFLVMHVIATLLRQTSRI